MSNDAATFASKLLQRSIGACNLRILSRTFIHCTSAARFDFAVNDSNYFILLNFSEVNLFFVMSIVSSTEQGRLFDFNPGFEHGAKEIRNINLINITKSYFWFDKQLSGMIITVGFIVVLSVFK